MNALWRLDEQVFRAVHVGMRREWLDPIMVLLTWTGLGAVQGVILVMIMLRRQARPYAIAALASGAVAGLLRLGIVQYADRMRPSNFAFSTPLEQVYGNSSFPSGHASTSFAIALIVALMVRGSERAWIGWLVFAWASLVGLSRMYVGVHFGTDVLGGFGMGLIGASITYIVWSSRGWLPDTEMALRSDREQAAD